MKNNINRQNTYLNKMSKKKKIFLFSLLLISIFFLITLSIYLSFSNFINSNPSNNKKIINPKETQYITKNELLKYLSNDKNYKRLIKDIENKFNIKSKSSKYTIKFDPNNKEYDDYYSTINEINKDIIERTNKYSIVKEINNRKEFLIENYRKTIQDSESKVKQFLQTNLDSNDDGRANDFILGEYVKYGNNYFPINENDSFHIGYLLPERPTYIENSNLFKNYNWNNTIWKNKQDLSNFFINELLNTERSKKILGTYVIQFKKDNEEIFKYEKTYDYQDEFDLLTNEEKKIKIYNEWLKEIDNLNTNSLKIEYKTSYGTNGFKYWNKYQFISGITEIEDSANIKLVSITDIGNLGYEKSFFKSLPGFVSFVQLNSLKSKNKEAAIFTINEFKDINTTSIENANNLYIPKKGEFSIKKDENTNLNNYYYEGLLVKEINTNPTWVNLTINEQKMTLPVYTINNWLTKEKTKVQNLFNYEIDATTNLLDLKGLKEKNLIYLKNERSYLPLFSHALRIIENQNITSTQKEFRESELSWKNNYSWSTKMKILSPFGASPTFTKAKQNPNYNTVYLQKGLDKKASSIILPMNLDEISNSKHLENFYAFILKDPNKFWKFKDPSILSLPNDITLTHEYNIIYNDQIIKTISLPSKLFIKKDSDGNDSGIYNFESVEFRNLIFEENHTSIKKILKEALNIESFSFILTPPIPKGIYQYDTIIKLFDDLVKQVTIYNDEEKNNWPIKISSKGIEYNSIKIRTNNLVNQNFYLNKYSLYTYHSNIENNLNNLFIDSFLNKYYSNNEVDELLEDLLKDKTIIWEESTTILIQSKDKKLEKSITFNNLILGLLKTQIDLQNLYDYLIIPKNN